MSIVSTAVVKANMTSSGQPFLKIDPDLEKDEKTMKAVRQILDFMSAKWPNEYQRMIAPKGYITMHPRQYEDCYTIFGKYLLKNDRIDSVLANGLEGKTELSRRVQCAVAGDFKDMFNQSPLEVRPKSTLVKWSFFCLRDPACLDLEYFSVNAYGRPRKAALTLLAVAAIVMVVYYATSVIKDPFCFETTWIFLGVSLCVMIAKMQKALDAHKLESVNDYDKKWRQMMQCRASFAAIGIGKDTVLEYLRSHSQSFKLLDVIKEVESLKNDGLEKDSKERFSKITQSSTITSSGALLPRFGWELLPCTGSALESLRRAEDLESIKKIFSFLSERAPEKYNEWIAKGWSVTAHSQLWNKIDIGEYTREVSIGRSLIDEIRTHGLKGDTEISEKVQVVVVALFASTLCPPPINMKPPSDMFARIFHLNLNLKAADKPRGFIALVAEHSKEIVSYATGLRAPILLGAGSSLNTVFGLLILIFGTYKTYRGFENYKSECSDLQNKWIAERVRCGIELLDKCLGKEVSSKYQNVIKQILAWRLGVQNSF